MSVNLHRHLTHQQLCDVLLASQETSAEIEQLREHLHNCLLCSQELDSLRQPLASFHSATTAWAAHTSASRSWTPLDSSQFSWRRGIVAKFFARPVLWTSAAAVLLLATAVPLTLHHHQNSAQTSAALKVHPQSRPVDQIGDEALLEQIDQTLSSSIPTPMQPLADPTAGRTHSMDSTPRKN